MATHRPSDAPVSWRVTWEPFGLAPALALLALFLAVTTFQGLASAAALRAHGEVPALIPVLAGQFTGALAAWMVLPVVALSVRRAGVPDGHWARFSATHLGGYVLFALAHLAAMLLLRALVGLAIGRAAFGPIGAQIAYELRADLVLYPALSGVWYVALVRDERRASELRAARLEQALAESRLDALGARLDPHFLFNTLHTIGAVMHEDLARTETLLANLGDLLRVTLDEASRPTWTLAEERAHTERYIDIMRARFADRLGVAWSVAPGLDTRAIPRFSIQMLVENAIKHNQHREPLLVDVLVTDDEIGVLRIAVGDDGCGLVDDARKPGRGLARLQETIELLYGPGASLETATSPRGGALVAIRLPGAGAA
jgi:two-component system, LytTR family, sensor kinase